MLEHVCTLCGEKWWRFAMITDAPFVCHSCDFKRERLEFDKRNDRTIKRT